jgi:hypothetical protein
MINMTREERIDWFVGRIENDPNPVTFKPLNQFEQAANSITFQIHEFSAKADPGELGWQYNGRVYSSYVELGKVVAVDYADWVEGFRNYLSLFE